MASGGRRIAVLDSNKCKPSKCRQECKRSCPVVQTGKLCIEVSPASRIASISESLCIGCGICVKKCPFGAIRIVNLPNGLVKEVVHRYGPNSFVLHRLAIPRAGHILGLVGANGTGKSSVLRILSGTKPNLGKFDKPPDWKEILAYFRGSELQNYFTKWVEDKFKVVHKIQDIYSIVKCKQAEYKRLGDLISAKDERGVSDEICLALDLSNLLDRRLEDLSGGELQRFAIAYAVVQQADVYFFDEPSSFLDIKQRLKVAELIRSLVRYDNFVVVVEHDLSMLDYLSDQVCCLYGTPGAYGVVTAPFAVGEGINVFLDGYVPTENLRIRDESLIFKMADPQDMEDIKVHTRYVYPSMTKTMGNFKLQVHAGKFTDSQIIVMLGENGTGKTTFIKMLAGKLEPDNNGDINMPQLCVSYKPQSASSVSKSTVRKMLHKLIAPACCDPVFISDVMKPLQIQALMDLEVATLSGGEFQRVALCICLGKEADLYLIDEPSANLDAEQRVLAAKVIRRFIMHAKKTAFVVEHDFLMATYLADMVIVYDGKPSVDCVASSPESPVTGINRFLAQLGVTFRRDPENWRPRINKPNSLRDREQKSSGVYYDDSDPLDHGHHRRSSARSRRAFSS